MTSFGICFVSKQASIDHIDDDDCAIGHCLEEEECIEGKCFLKDFSVFPESEYQINLSKNRKTWSSRFFVVLMAFWLSIESTCLPPKVIHTKCRSDLLLFSSTKDFLSDRLIFQLRKGSFHERCFIFYVSKLHLWRHTIDNFIVIIVVEGLQD